MIINAEETPVPDRGNIVGKIAVHEPLVQERDASVVQGRKLPLNPRNAVRERVLARRKDGLSGLIGGK